MIVQFAFLCLLRLIFEETSLPKEWTFFLNCQCYYEKQIDNDDIVFMVFTLKDLRNTIKLYVQNFSVKPLAWSSWFDHMIMRFSRPVVLCPLFFRKIVERFALRSAKWQYFLVCNISPLYDIIFLQADAILGAIKGKTYYQQ